MHPAGANKSALPAPAVAVIPSPMRIGIVAGEASGDALGADLMRALKERVPNVMFEGIAGERMRRAGCTVLYPAEDDAVMGLVEVVKHLPRLLRMRKALARHFLHHAPAVFIGIDLPDFNLGLERRLKHAGIRTVHYVSPSVWAWRQNRVRYIAEAVDLLLALFPFEEEFYRGRNVPVCFVGHPLADSLHSSVDKHAARTALGLTEQGPLIALLPGSRAAEVEHLAPCFIHAAALVATRYPNAVLIAALADAATRQQMAHILERERPDLAMTSVVDQTHAVLAAADVALVACGTATLEAALLRCPAVVAYRTAGLTYWLLKRMVKVPYYALPNLLAGRELVREFIQDAATPANLAAAVTHLLRHPEQAGVLQQAYAAIHDTLRQDASRRAADSVLALLAH